MSFRIHPIAGLTAAVFAASALCAGAAQAQVYISPPSVRVEIPAPPLVQFEAEPELIEVESGIAVVPGYEQEVFFVDGLYWHRAHGRWYRTSDWHGGWVVAPPPYRLNRFPRGRYRNWRPEPAYRGAYRAGPRVVGPPPGRRLVDSPPPGRVVGPPPGRVVVSPPPGRVVGPPAGGGPGPQAGPHRRRHGE